MTKANKRKRNAEIFIKHISMWQSNYKGYFMQNNKQCFCNGFVAIILNDFIEDIEKAEENNRLDLEKEVFNRFYKYEILENIDIKTVEKVKGKSNRIFLKISDTYFKKLFVDKVKGILGTDIKAYTKIDEDSFMKDKVLFLENKNGQAVILCNRNPFK